MLHRGTFPHCRIQGDEGRKVRLTQCSRAVDHALRPVLNGESLPLVLAGTDPIASIFRNLCGYAGLTPETTGGNPDELSDKELAEAAAPILDAVPERPLESLRELCGQRRSADRATGDLARLARAAALRAEDLPEGAEAAWILRHAFWDHRGRGAPALEAVGEAMSDAGYTVTTIHASPEEFSRANGYPHTEIVVLPTALFVSARDVGEFRTAPHPFRPGVRITAQVVLPAASAVLLGASWAGVGVAALLVGLVGTVVPLASRVPHAFEPLVTVTVPFAVPVAVFLLVRPGVHHGVLPSLVAPLLVLPPRPADHRCHRTRGRGDRVGGSACGRRLHAIGAPRGRRRGRRRPRGGPRHRARRGNGTLGPVAPWIDGTAAVVTTVSTVVAIAIDIGILIGSALPSRLRPHPLALLRVTGPFPGCRDPLVRLLPAGRLRAVQRSSIRTEACT